jgi:hypothetical protein
MEDAIEWNFRTLVDGWILYGLPVLLLVVGVTVLIRRRSRPQTSADRESVLTVRRIGLIHCALAAQALIFLVQVLLTMRTMGIPQSFIDLIVGLVTTVVNPILAVGLLCFSRVTRRFALAWYVLLSLLSLVAVWWLYYYRVPIDPAKWPEQVASKMLPVFLWGVMLLPRIKRVFAKEARAVQPTAQSSDPDGVAAPAEALIRPPVISLLALLFLIVVVSNLAVDAADWGNRLVFETESVP